MVVDRDDDLGVKTGIKGPILGREEALKAANALLLSDPEDSDGNTIFAAIKIADELKKEGEIVQIAVVTGDRDVGIRADKTIREQMKEIFSKYQFDGIVFVTDGAEDDQVIPIISSFAPIVSKKTVVVRQAKELEKTFYTVKTALEDPSFARMFLGIPGIILLLWFLLQENALRIIIGILSIYLIIRGFGLEDTVMSMVQSFLRVDPHSISLPFHLASFALIIIGVFLSIHTSTYGSIVEAARLLLFFFWGAFTVFLLGKSAEAISQKRAYKIGDYLAIGGAITAGYVIGDGLLNIVSGVFGPLHMVFIFLVTVMAYYIVYKISTVIKRAPLLSEKIKGKPVYDRVGSLLGRVKGVDEDVLIIERGRRYTRVPLSQVRIVEGRIVI